MSTKDLMTMLEKNARDLQDNPTLMQQVTSTTSSSRSSLGRTIPKIIVQVMTSVGMGILHWAKAYPKAFTVLLMTILLLLYVHVTIPQTGLVLSHHRNLVSSGPTTWTMPPTKYLQTLVDHPRVTIHGKVGIQMMKTKWDDLLVVEEDGIHIHNSKTLSSQKSEWKQAMTVQRSINPMKLLENYLSPQEEQDHDDSNDDKDDDDTDSSSSSTTTTTTTITVEQQDHVLNLLMEYASTILATRQDWTDLVDETTPNQTVRLVTSTDPRSKYILLAVPGLGDFGRYGLVYMQVSQFAESDVETSITFTTLKGLSAWNGQLHLRVMKTKKEKTTKTRHPGATIICQGHLVVPKKGGKKLNQQLATNLLDALVGSLVQSTSRRTQQTLARHYQSHRFHDKAHRRATERRSFRFAKEQELEEMAADRRRRWQRTNPDAGRYRPSGVRQQSPNNC